MKNYYLLLAALFSFHLASATHIVGGTISYEYLGNNDYKIRLEVLRDCENGQPDFDNPAIIGIYDDANTLITTLAIPRDTLSNDTISIGIPNSVCISPPNLCIHKGVYEATINLPMISGAYTIAYQRCCRSQVITNLLEPLEAGMTFHTQIHPTAQSSSPVFKNEFPVTVFVNTPFVFDASAVDPDGDSLVYELVAPFAGGSMTIAAPNPPSPPPYDPLLFVLPTYSIDNMLGGNYPLTLNPQTGQMVAIPSTMGVFQIAYSVKKFRNGSEIGTTYREFTFVVSAIAPGQNYDISGSVLVDGVDPLDAGTVQIIERNVSNDSLSVYDEQPLGAAGTYAFTDIPPGVFYVKAIVDSSSMYYDNYLPTYFASAGFWYDADPISQCDTSQVNRDIHLINVDSLVMGPNRFDGLVLLSGSEEPAAGLNLTLATENGDLLQTRTTNAQGYFKFENLPTATYLLFADLLNSAIDNTNAPSIALNSNVSARILLYNDSLVISELATSLQAPIAKDKYSIKLFPNPSRDQLLLEASIGNAGLYSAQIYNLQGQLVYTVFENVFLQKGKIMEDINLDKLPKGAYYLQVQSEFGIETAALVKQ